MYDEQQLRDLVNLALHAGAHLNITHDKRAKAEEGRVLIETIQVVNKFAGFGPHPMGAFYACEKLREAKAKGLLGPIVREVAFTAAHRERNTPPMARARALLSNGDSVVLFDFNPNEIGFEERDLLGKTPNEARKLKALKEANFVLANERKSAIAQEQSQPSIPRPQAG